jgi:AmmeMemoRadiSam system protein B/AmmeMemoRadiSam system protein A
VLREVSGCVGVVLFHFKIGKMMSVEREPVVAGSFYSSDPKGLVSQLEMCFSDYKDVQAVKNISALVVPHAGYVYSGKVAASAYSLIDRDAAYDNVFIVGSSHHVSFSGASVYNKGNYKTPLGVVPVNVEIANDLIGAEGVICFKESAHLEEHTIEVQLPFLQYQLKYLPAIIPIIIGERGYGLCKKIAEQLEPYFNSKNLFVFSTDLSHYPAYEDARMVDARTVEAVCANDADTLIRVLRENESLKIPNLYTSLCGWSSVLTLLYLTVQKEDYRYSKIKYMNSGDASELGKGRVVGYQSILIERKAKEEQEEILSGSDKEYLLKKARGAIERYLDVEGETGIKSGEGPEFNIPSSAFVSVYVSGKLRGCVGQFDSGLPLKNLIEEMAVSAAFFDTRFIHLTKDELDDLAIEISVLTPKRKIKDVSEIELGKHGVFIKKGVDRGTFLPQVATKTGWTLEEFMGHLAKDKAQIGWDGWKDAEVYVFEAVIFSDKKNVSE